MTETMVTNSRLDLARLYHSLSREDVLWSVKYLTDYLYSSKPIVQTTQPMPSWWNRKLSPQTQAMRIVPACEITDDYKAELESILVEKYI